MRQVRLFALVIIGLVGSAAGCGSEVDPSPSDGTSTTQPVRPVRKKPRPVKRFPDPTKLAPATNTHYDPEI
jgi:hypothetical protein